MEQCESGGFEKLKRDAIFKKTYKIIVIVLCSLSLVLLLFDVSNILGLQSPYNIYLTFFPILVLCFLKIWIIHRIEREWLEVLIRGCWLSAIEFLILLGTGHILIDIKVKIIIYTLTIICFPFVGKAKSENRESCTENEIDKEKNNLHKDKHIFSLYYVNTDKVYEIAMLLNNRIVTSATEENTAENLVDQQTKLGVNANIDYLKMIKGGLELSKGVQVQNSTRSKVLESFDVKTTKSNMLASIIEKSKPIDNINKIEMGDLICIKNAELELLNTEDTYVVTKLLLNGAFNDTKVSSNDQNMKIEMNLSSIINSLLKDCVYELDCKANNKEFLLTIPMTFENDFENSYNIYDLQVGKVTVVGIYRGKELQRQRMSLQEMLSENGKNRQYATDELQLKSSTGLHSKHSTNDRKRNLEVIDVIAIIQEINAK